MRQRLRSVHEQPRCDAGDCVLRETAAGDADGGTGAPIPSARAAPRRRGLGLGLRLGLLVTLIVVGVMAAVTGAQLALDLRSELRARQSLLRASLSPLVAQLQAESEPDKARAAIVRFHSSYLDGGHLHHRLAVLDAGGRVIAEAGKLGGAGTDSLLSASVPLASSGFAAQPVDLVVTQDSTDLSASRAGRWRAWAAHVGLTALLTLALLFAVIRREVTGPIERLLGGIRKMELGYWGDVPDPRGAWEIRWLGWRFHTLGQELSLAVERLVAAQRRAYAASVDAGAGADVQAAGDGMRTAAFPQERVADDAVGRLEHLCHLQARLERFRRAEPGDREARSAAPAAWDIDARQAGRPGQPGLRISLEDAALRMLAPQGFDEVARQLEARRVELDTSAKARSERVCRALAARQVPVVDVSRRVKHLAGVWQKMREKDLAFEQVHDLVALRIVVPTEADCYHALGVVHDLYAPLVGRFKDYIAQPKPNGYRSLHTSVRDSNGAVFEVQIRSVAMHQLAECGEAAHITYKEARWSRTAPEPNPRWRRILAAFRRGAAGIAGTAGGGQRIGSDAAR